MKCRHCATPLIHTFLDLGFAPPSNAYLTAEDLNRPEKHYPLKTMVCDQCWLVQTEDHAAVNELFSPDYAYFSSTSTSWLAHAARYVQRIIPQLGLTRNSLVIEIAANDGYLLKNFVAAGISCMGIEPTASTAAAAKSLGIPVLQEFFCAALADTLAGAQQQADLIIGNNVYAHVPDINDFTQGLKRLLKPHGTITLEFPHLMRLIEHCQFDTIYHEHFSYLSLGTTDRIFRSCGLRIRDVEELPTHGGSLRIFGCHADDPRPTTPAVHALMDEEKRRSLQELPTYKALQASANRIKDDLLRFLIEQKFAGKSVAAYGAAAKGNTLLNYGGIRPDLLPFIYDAAPSKQGKYMPGSHIPILPPAQLATDRPDFLLILPWNIADEVKQQNSALLERGAKLLMAIPELRIL